MVRGLHHDLGALSAGGAAALADDRRAPGSRSADPAAPPGGGDDPGGSGHGIHHRGSGAPRTPPGPSALRKQDPLLDPRRRRPLFRRQLFCSRIPRRQSPLRALRGTPPRGVDGPDVIRPCGRRGNHERTDGGGARHRRGPACQPHRGPARICGARGQKPCHPRRPGRSSPSLTAPDSPRPSSS